MTAFAVPSNLAFDDYTDLTAGISDWMNRNDLDGAAQSMIALAEARMRRKLEPYFTEATTSVTTDTLGYAALPSDCATVSRVVYEYYTIPRWSGFTVDALTENSEPVAYTVEANALRIWPATSITVTLFYQTTLPQLSEANPSNSLLAMFPDLYFFGAMMFAEGYVANDSRATLFKSLFDEALEEAATYLSRQRYVGPLVPRIVRQM